MTEDSKETEATAPDTTNDFGLCVGQNLPNHSMSIAGRSKFVRQTHLRPPVFRTKQQAFRYAAWLIELADINLPNYEGVTHTFEEVRNAIQNS